MIRLGTNTQNRIEITVRSKKPRGYTDITAVHSLEGKTFWATKITDNESEHVGKYYVTPYHFMSALMRGGVEEEVLVFWFESFYWENSSVHSPKYQDYIHNIYRRDSINYAIFLGGAIIGQCNQDTDGEYFWPEDVEELPPEK